VTITAMIAKAAAMSLEDFPIMAGRWIDRIDRIYCPKKEEMSIFCPVQVGDFAGSIFMENMNMKSLIEIAEELDSKVKRIRENVAVDAEAQIFPPNPFFAISNVGTIGCVESCSAQLTGDIVSELVVCSIIDKVVKNGMTETRKMMNCVLIWDHHALLANTPIEFMMKMKKYLEDPESYLMKN
jgi:Pyruvate/2-oxoglutarate dehydrogenase complex, dihydrolipoamide acyltransferase (E2) component, and related enzymes